MVDEFEKKYNALEVPEPVDTQTDKINAQEQEATKSAAEYVQASKSRIVQHEKQLEKFRTMIPFDQMTFEDLNEVFPETKLDKEKYPYWPIEDLQICLKAVSGDCISTCSSALLRGTAKMTYTSSSNSLSAGTGSMNVFYSA
ncbi:unnamed protein product [Lepidochelys kempii]